MARGASIPPRTLPLVLTAHPPSPTSLTLGTPPTPLRIWPRGVPTTVKWATTQPRDGGAPDPTGGTDCAHPVIGGVENAEIGTATDQYAMRHNPFMYFHSVIDNQAVCNANVVPLGKLLPDGTPDPAG